MEWNSNDESCADAGAIVAATRDLLGGELPARPLQARADVTHDAQGWRVQLVTELADQRGERAISGESCAAIQRAVALILVLVLEPHSADAEATDATDGGAETRATGSLPPSVSPPPPDRRPPAAPASPAAATRLYWSVAAEGGGGLRVTPDLGLSAGGALAVTWSRFDFGLSGRYWFPRERDRVLENDPLPAIRVKREELQVYACWRALELAESALVLSPCVAPGIALTHVESIRVTRSADTSKLSAIAALSLHLEYFPLDHFFVRLSPAVVFEQKQPFVLKVHDVGTNGTETTPPEAMAGDAMGDGAMAGDADPGVDYPVYYSPPISGRLTLAIGVRF